ncbi:hypothetical protein GYMLUDRAFT_995195 [Collybiopsis luxurians FD-317 M1]|uniref:O-methyltransferase domain-containing protein n=1 Tax=Collybiopsis luxurians FD-317 M1 TaxID=944289 RepID=A0A0D0CSJ2_9AGAR|nr:hypothetical protein GYMLUDRAFT_995195 [Collybiopsis luxurians FD-317 M1]
MAKFDNSHITGLTNLINEAVQVVIHEYAAVGQAVPSLDTLEPGPFSIPEELPAQLRKAIQIIEAACAQLSCTVSLPGTTMRNHEEPACLLVATEARIADILLDKPEGLPASELALRSSLDAGKLERILRLLSTQHCFKEVKPGIFANNRLSTKLLSSDLVSSLVCLGADENHKASAYLNSSLTNPSEADDGIPFKRATGHTFFDYYKIVGRFLSSLKVQFYFFSALNQPLNLYTRAYLKVYPWPSQPVDTTVCDVGGGNGHIGMSLLKSHPHLKLVLQDQPHVIEAAKLFWEKEHRAAMENQRVNFVPINFFEDVTVEGCDFYYVVLARHNWPDTKCELILKNIRKSMKPSSRVLIRGYLVHPLARSFHNDDSQTDIAPYPLLPNYGAARIMLYNIDLVMMNILDSKERTFDELVELCKKSGLAFESFYESGETELLEFSPI